MQTYETLDTIPLERTQILDLDTPTMHTSKHQQKRLTLEKVPSS